MTTRVTCDHSSYWITIYGNCMACENDALRAQLAALTLTWTREKPTTPGWYWWRLSPQTKKEDLVIFQVFFGVKTQRWYAQGGPRPEDIFPVYTIHGEWAGPIPLPTEARREESGETKA